MADHLGGAPERNCRADGIRFPAFLARRRNQGGKPHAGAPNLEPPLLLPTCGADGLFRNPALSALRSPKLPHAVPKPLSPEKAGAVTKADELATEETPGWVLARDQAVLTLLYACGLRISEALDLPRRRSWRMC